jgi:hypothetical protein
VGWSCGVLCISSAETCNVQPILFAVDACAFSCARTRGYAVHVSGHLLYVSFGGVTIMLLFVLYKLLDQIQLDEFLCTLHIRTMKRDKSIHY